MKQGRGCLERLTHGVAQACTPGPVWASDHGAYTNAWASMHGERANTPVHTAGTHVYGPSSIVHERQHRTIRWLGMIYVTCRVSPLRPHRRNGGLEVRR
jgi:hypothetical protein